MVYRHRQNGFTLLEVLVVLVITSMLSLLLIDGIGQVLSIEQRMSARLRESRVSQLQEYWLRQVIAGVHAHSDYPFEMSQERIAGMTLAPLSADPGIPTAFELAIVNLVETTELRYREGQGDFYTLWEVANTQLVNPPRFFVLSEQGTYETRWRSKQGGQEWPPGLALRIEGIESTAFWHLAVEGRRTPKLTVEEIMGL